MSANKVHLTNCKRLSNCLDEEFSKIACFRLYPCNSDGEAALAVEDLGPSKQETDREHKRRKAQVAKAIREGSYLPLDLRLRAGLVRFRCSPLQPEEQEAWIGQATARLDLKSGFLFAHDRILQVVPGVYRIDAYCYLPNEAAAERLATVVDGWNISLPLIDNLKEWWRLSQPVKCPWNSRSLKRSVAVILQLTPDSNGKAGDSRLRLQCNREQEFVLDWKFRPVRTCTYPIDGTDWSLEDAQAGSGFDEGLEDSWQIAASPAKGRKSKEPGVKSRSQTQAAKSSAANQNKPIKRGKAAGLHNQPARVPPRFPLLFANEEFQRFRTELLARIDQAIERGKADMTTCVPTVTAALLKEFDELAEDSTLNQWLVLVLACIQIECGFIEQWVAEEALVNIPAVKYESQLLMDASRHKKFVKELSMLEEDIQMFSE